MTQPTQAQIEEATRAIFVKRFGRDRSLWSCKEDAAAALNAAAQVGEPEDWIEKRRAIRQSAIERCAQVVERYAINIGEIAFTISAELRKLKDVS